jgi:hypothetical protein
MLTYYGGMRNNWVVTAALAALSTLGRADIVLRSDHTYSDDKVISQDVTEIVVQSAGGEEKHVPRAEVVRVITTDDHGAALTDTATKDSNAAHGAEWWGIPAEPAAPPVVAPPNGSTYYVIPLHGEVGKTVQTRALEKSLADAVLRKPTVVVLDIDSPGGSVEEAESIVKVLHRYNKVLRIVALADQDLSAAAIISLSVKEIYVKSSCTIGAATPYTRDDQGTPMVVEEKFRSIWRATARNSADEGGHEPLLADAMIDNSGELHLETDAQGKVKVVEGPGKEMLVRKGKILALTSHEALHCGLARGEAEDIDELGKALHLEHWTECKGLGTLLADALPARVTALSAAFAILQQELKASVLEARRQDPRQRQLTAVHAGFNGTPFVQHLAPPPPTSQRLLPIPPMQNGSMRSESGTASNEVYWKQRSLACVVALEQVEKILKDAVSLETAADNTGSAESAKEELAKVTDMRVAIYDERNRFGEGWAFPISGTVTARPINEGEPASEVMTVQKAEEALASGGYPRTQASFWLSRATVTAVDQKAVIKLLTPLIEPLDSIENEQFLEAYAHWAGPDEAAELTKVLRTPAKTEENPSPMNLAWGDAAFALERIDRAAAEKIIAERKDEQFFRSTVNSFLMVAAIRHQDQSTIDRLNSLLGEK